MAIKNYTTSIDSEKTIAEINKILVEHGATKIMLDYEGSMPVKLVFKCVTKKGVEMDFSLPCRWKATHNILNSSKGIAVKHRTEEQAIRTSWRIIKDWVDAQMALVELELVDIEEVFLPYALINNKQTVYDGFKDVGFKLLNR